MTEPLGD